MLSNRENNQIRNVTTVIQKISVDEESNIENDDRIILSEVVKKLNGVLDNNPLEVWKAPDPDDPKKNAFSI